MNRELRRLSTLMLAMFLGLFASATVIQVIQKDALQQDPRNVRTLYASFSVERGSIIAGDTILARSVPSDDEYAYQRIYPGGEVYAPVTGYFTLNGVNTGIEGNLNEYLSGRAGEQFLDRLNAVLTGQPPRGATIEVTIDPFIQQKAWDALGDLRGSVVVLEPHTGRILAMVTKPSYDPSLLASHNQSVANDNYEALLASPDEPLINRAITGDLNPPGSTFKIVVLAAALANGYTPESLLPNPPTLTLPGTRTTITNSGGSACGGEETVTLATAFLLSCNIPFAELGQALGYPVLADQARRFGFADDSWQIPMPVAPSSFPQPANDAQLMLQSFGQGNDRVTPLQVALLSAAVAQGGEVMLPKLVERISEPDLTVLEEFEPERFGRAMSGEVAQTIREMMVRNVSSGVANGARIAGIEVGGKTGTAENGEEQPYSLWFTGFAPADDPQLAIAVVLEDGAGRGQTGTGNGVAAPIAKEIMEAVLTR